MSPTVLVADFHTARRGDDLLSIVYRSAESQFLSIVCVQLLLSWHKRCRSGRLHSGVVGAFSSRHKRRNWNNAFDTLRDSLDSVAGRRRFELHDGRLHPLAACNSACRIVDQPDKWSENRSLDSANRTFNPPLSGSSRGEGFRFYNLAGFAENLRATSFR